jgi:hypothetical protein
MKLKFCTFFFLFFSFMKIHAGVFSYCPAFDKKTFYKAIESENSNLIEEQFKPVKALSLPDRDAYEGTLLMRKAGLIKNKKQQLALFKEGKIKLESAIAQDSINCEYRLLRLMIQENAPSILGYNKQMKEDADFIADKFSTLSAQLQAIALDYSKHSKKLKLPAN